MQSRTISPEWNFTCIIYHQTYRYSITNDVKTPPSSFKSILTLDQSYRKRERESLRCPRYTRECFNTTISQAISILEEIPLARNRPEAHPPLSSKKKEKKKKSRFFTPPPSFLEERNHRFSSNFLPPSFLFAAQDSKIQFSRLSTSSN